MTIDLRTPLLVLAASGLGAGFMMIVGVPLYVIALAFLASMSLVVVLSVLVWLFLVKLPPIPLTIGKKGQGDEG